MTNSLKLCLKFIREFLFTVHIMNLVSNVCVTVSSGIPGIKLRTADLAEDNIAYPEYRSIVGDRVQLPCNISIPSKDDIITLILWYRGDTTGAPIYTMDARQMQSKQSKHFLSDDLINRAALNISVRPAILTIDPVRGEDEGEYRCRVDFRWGRTMNTVVSLIVIVPPRKVIVKNEKLEPLEELVGPYQEDSDVRLTCEAKGARPPAVVQWYRYNQLIDDSFQIIQEGSRVRNELTINKVDRNDLFAVFRCQAFNTNHTVPIEAKVILDINLRPLNVEILSNSQPLIAGRKIDVICLSTGARPSAQITWFKNKKKLLTSSESYSDDGNTTRSVITLTPVPDDNGIQLVCRADNTRIANSSIEDSWTLNVHYEPRVSLVMTTNHKNNIVAEGNEVLMDCKTKANPLPIDYNWFYEQRLIKSDSLQGIFLNNSTLIIKSVNRKHNGKYYCLASNTVGRGKSNDLTLTVDYAPVCKSGQKIVYGIGLGETAKVLCDIDARPPQVFFHWTFNDTYNPNLQFISEGLRSSLSYSPKTRDDFGVVSCWGKNVVGNQQVPCLYTLIPAGKPETVLKCETSNIGFTSLSINCLPGYDGGLQQSFGLEVYEAKDVKLVLNLTNSRVSAFDLSSLQPNTHYNIKVYAINVKGKSEPVSLSIKTNISPVPSEETIESEEEWNDLIQNLVIIAVILVIIAILIVLICKTLRKFQQKMSEECDEEVNSDDKSDDMQEYEDNMSDHKNYQNQNGILPQEYNQTNVMSASNYMNDRTNENRNYYEVYEIELQEDCDQNYIDFNNQTNITYRLTDDLNQWSPHVSSKPNQLEMYFPTESLQRHRNNSLYYNNTLNNNRSAHRSRKSSYTSTPV